MLTTDFQQVLSSPLLAYEEGLDFFEGKGTLNETLRKLVEDLENHGIDYAVIGAVALNQHGYQRFTSDIDLLMTADGLEKFRQELVGLGYVPKFEGAKKMFRATFRNVPFASVVEVAQDEMPEIFGPSLVVSAITNDQKLIDRLIASPHVDRLNIGPIPTMQIAWDQPHEGNLFEHLYARRAFQKAATA